MRLPLNLTVYGRPQPAGSKRAFVNRSTGKVSVVDASKGSRPWKQEVTATALEAWGPHAIAEQGPVVLDLRFFLARPKGHYRTGKNAHLLKASAPEYPTGKPDTLKLTRAVEDALTGLAYKDDAQVVHQVASKHYGSPERCEIRVRTVTSVTRERDDAQRTPTL